MRTRTLLAVAVAAALAVPALAEGRPARFQVEGTVAPGKSIALSVGKVPRGEFRFTLRASSDGEKRLRLTQRRAGGRAFTVLALPGPAAGACQGAAGTLVCTRISTPATPAGRTWTFRLRNRSDRPMSVRLTVVWRGVASAG